ncbi:hypothetical protein HDR67_02700 [bacterium]|nr:hypothetical protein [bacterium]
MKKLRSIFVIMCVALIITVFYKKILFVSASEYDSISLSTLEKKQLSELVFKKLNIVEYNYEIISGFNSKFKYVLVEGDNSYLIYDREQSDYLEYGNEYYNCISKFLYLCSIGNDIVLL